MLLVLNLTVQQLLRTSGTDCFMSSHRIRHSKIPKQADFLSRELLAHVNYSYDSHNLIGSHWPAHQHEYIVFPEPLTLSRLLSFTM